MSIELHPRDRAFLFRVQKMGGISSLVPLLESKETIKAGVGIGPDIKVGFLCNSIYDYSSLWIFKSENKS